MNSKIGSSVDFNIYGIIESKRKDNTITIVFDKEMSEMDRRTVEKREDTLKLSKKLDLSNNYNVRVKKENIGSLNIKSVITNPTGRQKFRIIADYTPANPRDAVYFHVGAFVILDVTREEFLREFPDSYFVEYGEYRKIITSAVDKREMILVPAGKFIFGSNTGNSDEYPQQIEYTEGFYIDRYEVSNNDYFIYMEATNSDKPITWATADYHVNNGELPVLVTYSEAAEYARWAGKRLPTEKEWEKAARGILKNEPGYDIGSVYPWGLDFDSSRLNSIEFWSGKNIGVGLKSQYDKGFLPVSSFSDSGASPYGVVNMSGNANEWTSSWYLPYNGNKRKNPKFGTQYKVIRGGAWYHNWNKVRVTNREIGGAPNLYRDNYAGFRCVKEITVLDLEYKIE